MINQISSDLENKFLATFEQAAVGIAHVAPNGSWLRVNSRLCEIVGYDRAALMQMTFQDMTHPDDLAIELDYVDSMLDRKIDHYSMEKRYIRKDGKLIWINLTVSLVWTKENSPDYFISVVEDISLRKLAENEVKRLRNSLVEVQESERRFIALELHDEFGQRLGAANIVLSLAQKMNSVAAVDDLLMQAKSIIDGLIKTTKEMAQQLHPAQLDYFGLSAAVRALVAEVSQQVDIFIQLNELIGNLRFHSSTELTAYRVIQEALSNALRHSKTIEITVTLSVENDFLNVRISDSGIGLPKAQEHSQGLGLLGMQERVQSVGGVFSVRSQALSGTEVHAVLPLTVRGKN